MDRFLAAEQIDVLAKMPTLDQARAMLMSVMIAPVTKLARTLNEFPAFYHPRYGSCCRREEERSLIAVLLFIKRFLVNPNTNFRRLKNGSV